MDASKAGRSFAKRMKSLLTPSRRWVPNSEKMSHAPTPRASTTLKTRSETARKHGRQHSTLNPE
ncbi:hypothetical protein [Pyxidicoccus xibeiensis]|uniref:hypothetical protein n=1 Tax=Pyxidicoccus xibeiensis TaxID=2906759 RepID=UPI0020A6FA32|nr:hypothetical protein [Pyxidicoccus xibeiensis]MCP3143851.1 hypothetical protein [Pyxidicoccus xibeiensis]